jgi:hypothetical protein
VMEEVLQQMMKIERQGGPRSHAQESRRLAGTTFI